MSANSAVGTTAPESDPIADARALVAMAISLGQRTRTAQRLGQVTDRKASLYVNTLVRHAARLLQSTTSHDVPVLRAGSNGPGGNSVHYVVRHDRMVGPPSAMRFLTVGSDARLRCCVVADHGGARIWAEYDVSSSPDDLSLRVVLDALSAIVARLEQSVIQLESREMAREAQLEADIATSKARIAGLPIEAPQAGKRQVESEEPVRPWTRHMPAAPALAEVPVQDDEPIESIFAPPPRVRSEWEPPTPDNAVPTAQHDDTEEPARRRGFKLKRLDRAI